MRSIAAGAVKENKEPGECSEGQKIVKSRRNSTQLTEIDTVVRALLQERVALCMEHVDGSLGVLIHHWLLLMAGHSVSANDLDTILSSRTRHVPGGYFRCDCAEALPCSPQRASAQRAG